MMFIRLICMTFIAAFIAYFAMTTSLDAQCIPFTCADISLTGGTPDNPNANTICGQFGDGCGGTLNCSLCPEGQTCGGGGIPFQCGSGGTCTPVPCGSLAGIECGAGDGCGNLMNCGCISPEICGGSGTPYVCGCTPLTCQTAGIGCGLISDGCGGFLFCNKCDPGDPNLTCIISQLSTLTTPTSKESAILTALANSPNNRFALKQLTGRQYFDIIPRAELASERFIHALFVPVRSIITTNPNCSCNEDCCSCRLTLWGEASYNNAKSRHHCQSQRYYSNGYELTIGAQTNMTPSLTFGTAFSYAYDHLHYTHSHHDNSQDYFGGIYSIYRPCGFYLLADYAFGYRTEHASRHINLSPIFPEPIIAKAKPKTFQSVFYGECGVDLNYCDLLFQPFAGLEIGYYSRKSFCEHGESPLNLNVKSKEQTNTYASLGIHMSTSNLCNFQLGVDLAWQYRCSNFQNHLEQRFIAFGNTCKIKERPTDRNAFDGGVYIKNCLCNGVELFADASTQMRKKIYTYSILLGLQSKF